MWKCEPLTYSLPLKPVTLWNRTNQNLAFLLLFISTIIFFLWSKTGQLIGVVFIEFYYLKLKFECSNHISTLATHDSPLPPFKLEFLPLTVYQSSQFSPLPSLITFSGMFIVIDVLHRGNKTFQPLSLLQGYVSSTKKANNFNVYEKRIKV